MPVTSIMISSEFGILIHLMINGKYYLKERLEILKLDSPLQMQQADLKLHLKNQQ